MTIAAASPAPLSPVELILARAIATSGRVNERMDARIAEYVTTNRASARELARERKRAERAARPARETAARRAARAKANREYALTLRAEWEDARNALLTAAQDAMGALVAHARKCDHARALGVTYELAPSGKAVRTIAPDYLAFDGDWSEFTAAHFCAEWHALAREVARTRTAARAAWEAPILAHDLGPNGRFVRSVAKHDRFLGFLGYTAEDTVSQGLILALQDTDKLVDGSGFGFPAGTMVPTMSALYKACKGAYRMQFAEFTRVLGGKSDSPVTFEDWDGVDLDAPSSGRIPTTRESLEAGREYFQAERERAERVAADRAERDASRRAIGEGAVSLGVAFAYAVHTGMSVKDVAEMAGLSQETVNKHMVSAQHSIPVAPDTRLDAMGYLRSVFPNESDYSLGRLRDYVADYMEDSLDPAEDGIVPALAYPSVDVLTVKLALLDW